MSKILEMQIEHHSKKIHQLRRHYNVRKTAWSLKRLHVEQAAEHELEGILRQISNHQARMEELQNELKSNNGS